MSPRKTIVYTAIGLLWCFGIITVYYVSHKPFGGDFAIGLGLALLRLLIALALAAIAGGIGRSLWKAPELHPLARMALQAALGFGIMSVAVLLVGVSIGFSGLLFWAVTLALIVLLRKPIAAWFGDWRGWGQLFAADGLARLLAVLLGLAVLPALLLALAPPVKYDAQMYHLVMPAAYLRAGRIAYLPWLAMTGMPQNMEMLFTWAMALGGLPAAPVLGWLVGCLAVTGLSGYTAQRFGLRDGFGPRAGWIAAAGLLGGFTLAISLGWGYVDWLGLYFGVGALVCLDEWRQSGRPRDAILAGAFAGFALGSKYPAGVLGLVAFGVLAWHAWRTRRAFIPAGLRFGIAGILPALPYIAKNFVTTGNPLYPFLVASGAMTTVRMNVYQGMAPFGNWKDFFLLPFQATYLGIDGAAGYSVSVGPLLLALGALAWVGWKAMDDCQKPSLENAAGLALLGWLVWAAGNRVSGFLIQTRFYFALFPAFAFLCAAGFWGLSQLKIPGLRLERVLIGAVVLVLGLNILETGATVLKDKVPQAALELESEQAYRTDTLGWFEIALEAVDKLPEGTRVLLLYEPRSLYCQPKCLPDEILDRWKRDWTTYHDDQAVLDAWRKEGFTHVLYYKMGADFMRTTGDVHVSPADWQALDAFLATLPKPVDFGDTYLLYDLRSAP